MIDNISGVKAFEVSQRLYGDGIVLRLEKKYAADVSYLDVAQAEALGKSLIEVAIGLRELGAGDAALLSKRPTEG